jgi:hypothetical protein
MASPTRLDFGQFPVQTVQNSSQNNQSFNVCSSHIMLCSQGFFTRQNWPTIFFWLVYVGRFRFMDLVKLKRFTCPRLAVSQT